MFHRISALLSCDISSGDAGKLSESATLSSTMSSSLVAPLIETASRRYGLKGTGVGMRKVYEPACIAGNSNAPAAFA